MTAGVLTSVAVVQGLDDYQFELDGYRFGRRCAIFVDRDGFDPGTNDWTSQDEESSLTGARYFGRDVRSAQTWSFMLHVDQEDDGTALAELAAMGSIWNGGVAGFTTSRDVRMLRYRLNGRTRVVFGRPRNFDYKPDNRFQFGYLPPAAKFVKADALHYDDEEMSLDLRLGVSVPGGFSWPASWPLTFNTDPGFVPPSDMVVGGDAPTGLIVEFQGPSFNPAVTIGGVKLALEGTINAGAVVRVDARPWSLDVTRRGSGASATLRADTRLNRLKLKPGAYDAIYTGTDDTGTSRCRVFWRNAYHTL